MIVRSVQGTRISNEEKKNFCGEMCSHLTTHSSSAKVAAVIHRSDYIFLHCYTKSLHLHKANFVIFCGVSLFIVTGPYYITGAWCDVMVKALRY